MGLGVIEPDAVIAGTYRIVRLVGRGGMGEVFEVRHERTGAPLAIKVLLADFSERSEVIARFQREAEVTSRLRHPNIVTVFDFDRLPDGRPFLVMELLSGADLGSVMQGGQALPPARVAQIIEQVALALAATHAAGVVHRDLSPSNIFIEQLPGTDRDLVRVLDFGISKVRDAHSALTHTKVIMGTPHYMSPEQALGRTKETDGRADQFALAAISYELLTGRRPFASDDPREGDSAPAVLYRVVHGQPRRFADLGVAMPAAVEEVVCRALAKDPGDRYPNIIAFSAALAQAVQGGLGETKLAASTDAATSDVGNSVVARPISGSTLRLDDSAVGMTPHHGGTRRLEKEADAPAGQSDGASTTLTKATGEMAAVPGARDRKPARWRPARGVWVALGAAAVVGLSAAVIIRGSNGGSNANSNERSNEPGRAKFPGPRSAPRPAVAPLTAVPPAPAGVRVPSTAPPAPPGSPASALGETAPPKVVVPGAAAGVVVGPGPSPDVLFIQVPEGVRRAESAEAKANRSADGGRQPRLRRPAKSARAPLRAAPRNEDI